MMKILIVSVISILCISARADEFSGYSNFLKEHISKLQRYMEKNKSCHLAFLEVEDKSKKQTFNSKWMNRLFCIADAKRGRGINAKSGCFVLQFDTQKGRLHDIYKQRLQPEPPFVKKIL